MKVLNLPHLVLLCMTFNLLNDVNYPLLELTLVCTCGTCGACVPCTVEPL